MTRLRLVSRTQEAFEQAFAAHAASFCRAHPDIEIEPVYLPIHDLYEMMAAGSVPSAGPFDLFLCCTDWLPMVTSKGLLTPLDSFVSANPPRDWPEGWHPAMHALTRADGKLFGIPWHDGPEVLHYRSDLFEEAKEREEFKRRFGRELAVPATWSEFLETAQFFTRPEEGLWGCCEAAYEDGHNNVYDFLIQLWSRGGVLFDENWEPQFQNEIGTAALQFYVDLFHRHKVASQECLKLGSVECGDYYAAGNAAMSWNWIGFAATCELPTSKIVGKNRCARIPAGDGPNGESISLNIYWVLTIPADSPHKEEAYQFLRHTCEPEMDKATSMSGANGTRLSTWRDPDVRRQFPYYEVIEAIHGSTRTLPAIPEYGELNECISRAVQRSVSLEMPPEESLKIAADECREILHARRQASV